MELIYNSHNIIIHNFEVYEKIDKNSLKNFLLSSLKLKNITLKKDEKIIFSYIRELKIYQLLIFKKKAKYTDFQVFENINILKKDSFSFVIFQNFLYIFKNQKFYYIQEIKDDLNRTDFIEFLKSRFSMDKIYLQNISNEEFGELKKHYLNRKKRAKLRFFNYKKEISLFIYLSYLFLLILLTALYLFEIEDEKVVKEDIDLKKIDKIYHFNSFNEELLELLFAIQRSDLELNELKYQDDIFNIRVASTNKNDILSFLKNSDFLLFNSEMKAYEDKNFEAKADVKISK